jgi:hypothetical protein
MTIKLTARALKCTLILDPAELAALPDPIGSRVTIQISVAGNRTVTADIAAKSLRKARAVIAEHGADKVALIVQGKLFGDNAVTEAGLVAQLKGPPKGAGEPVDAAVGAKPVEGKVEKAPAGNVEPPGPQRLGLADLKAAAQKRKAQAA